MANTQNVSRRGGSPEGYHRGRCACDGRLKHPVIRALSLRQPAMLDNHSASESTLGSGSASYDGGSFVRAVGEARRVGRPGDG
jgi:hypothetical protein